MLITTHSVIDPDGHDPEEPEPPRDPRPVVPLPPIPGAPPLVVPGPTASTPKGPTDAEIIEGAQKVLDTVADYTGITWIGSQIKFAHFDHFARNQHQHQPNQKDTGLRDQSVPTLPKEPVIDQLPKAERQRYKKEKARRERNRKKREDK